MKHPTERRLSEFAAAELPPLEMESVEAHLTGCERCEREVEAYRELRQRARDLTDPAPPAGFIDEVLLRRASGERVLLSTGDAPTVDRGSRWTAPRVAAVAALALLALTVSYSVLAPPITASKGELRILPAMPTPGSNVEFEYRPISYLAGEDSLRLRARARQAGDPPPRGGLIGDLRITTLHRRPDGTYAGRISVGPDDVFLAAAVEDFEGRNVDTNFGKLWEIFVADESGEPSAAALEARYRILEYYNPVLATGWAEELTRRYPNEAIGWALFLTHEQTVFGDDMPPERVRSHEARLDTLVKRSVESGASAEQLRWLAYYARRLGRRAQQRALLERLAAIQPTHPSVQNERLLDVLRKVGRNPDAQLAGFDSLWNVDQTASEVLVHGAMSAAVAAGDADALLRWIERNDRLDRLDSEFVLDYLGEIPALHGLRLSELQVSLDSLRATGDERRPLNVDRAEYERGKQRRTARKEWDLAEALLTAGDTLAALDLYASANGPTLEPDRLARHADVLISADRVEEARRVVAMLVADPLSGDEVPARLASLLPQDSVERRTILDAGREELRRLVISSLDAPRPVSGNPKVTLADGRTTTLRALIGNQPAVLAMWAPPVISAEALMETIRRNVERTRDIETIVVQTAGIVGVLIEDRPFPDGDDITVITERAGDVATALNVFAYPAYVVLDRETRVIAKTEDIETAYRIAAVSDWR